MPDTATTTLASKGLVVIPEAIRDRLGLMTGAQFIVVADRPQASRCATPVFGPVALAALLVQRGVLCGDAFSRDALAAMPSRTPLSAG